MKRDRASFLFSLLLVAALVFYNVISQIVKVGFKTDIIASAEFWTSTVSTLLSNLSAWFIASRSSLTYEKLTNKTYIAKRDDVEKVSITSMEDDFDDFLIGYNRDRRRIRWENKISKKQRHVEKHARNKSLIKYRDLIPEMPKHPADALKYVREHTRNRYCRKKAKLSYLKSPEYIEENKDSLQVGHFKPYTKLQLISVYSDGNGDDELATRTAADMKAVSSKVLFAVSTGVFFNTLLPGWNILNPDMLLNVASSLAILFMNFYYGKQHGVDVISNVYIYNLTLVQQILDKYLAKKKKTKKEGSV